jgi:CPA2 family monovalent cation:H+ antiporter-2
LGLLDVTQSNFVLVLTAVTMALIPLLSLAAKRLGSALQVPVTDPQLAARPGAGEHRAIVVGFGRVGSVVCDLLQEHRISFIAVDRDPQTVTEARRRLSGVYYGNAIEPDFLRACGIERASGIILTLNVPHVLDDIVRVVRGLRPDIPIIARARDAEHARHLYLAGVTDAVPETIEASLQLSEAALVSLGVAMGPAIATVHEKRDEFRRTLQKAAQEAELAVRANAP